MTCPRCGRWDWLIWDVATCRVCGHDDEKSTTFTLESRPDSETLYGDGKSGSAEKGRDLRQRP